MSRLNRLPLLLLLPVFACAPAEVDDEDGDLEGDDTGWSATDDTGDDGGDDTGDDGSDGDGGDGGDGDGGDFDPDSVEGKAYMLDLANATWTEPPGVGGIISGYLDQTLLIGVDGMADTELYLLGTMTTSMDDPDQDPCVLTSDMIADYSTAPDFAVSEGDLNLSIAGVSIPLRDFSFKGTFNSSGVADGEISSSLDMRDVAPAMGFSAEDACATLSDFGVSCAACSDGVEFCVDALIEDIQGEEVDTTVEPVTEAPSGC